MNWDDYSDDEEENIKAETFKPIKIEDTEKKLTSFIRKTEDKANDAKRTNSASTKCTTSSFGYNKKYLFIN